ncbi:hypothetical protein [Secundilactobacillus silagei]|uniref:hypothetical protein n=1 Tax=Secundilactobacillus silagei TaxID=1293415 RepID=UPI001058DC52
MRRGNRPSDESNLQVVTATFNEVVTGNAPITAMKYRGPTAHRFAVLSKSAIVRWLKIKVVTRR